MWDGAIKQSQVLGKFIDCVALPKCALLPHDRRSEVRRDQRRSYYTLLPPTLLHKNKQETPVCLSIVRSYRSFFSVRDLLALWKSFADRAFCQLIPSWIRRKQEGSVTWETCAKPIGSTGGTLCSTGQSLPKCCFLLWFPYPFIVWNKGAIVGCFF